MLVRLTTQLARDLAGCKVFIRDSVRTQKLTLQALKYRLTAQEVINSSNSLNTTP